MFKKFIIFLTIFFIFFTSLVYADDTLSDLDISSEELENTIETSIKISDVPSINARHAIILDRSSKTTLYGKKENEICKMASTTKIMTAIVVIEKSNLNDVVTISKKAAHTGGSRLGLSTNNTITVENLLYGLMMRSRK